MAQAAVSIADQSSENAPARASKKVHKEGESEGK
jgi:hypothetical protein